MTATLQFIDRTTGAVVYDLNDPNAANASDIGYLATRTGADQDFAGPGWEFSRFAPAQGPGGTTTFARAGLRTMKLRVIFEASSYENYANAVNRLGQVLQEPSRLKWIADGGTVTKYIDVEPSPTPFFIDGRATSMYEAQRLFGLAEAGVELNLTTQPFWFGETLLDGSNILTNATLARAEGTVAGAESLSTGWSWSSKTNILDVSITSLGRYKFSISTGATRQLLQVTANSTVVAAETWCMSGYARVTDNAYNNVQVQAMIEYQTNAGAAVNTITGTLSSILTTTPTRVQVSGVASATATKAQPGLRLDNTTATLAEVEMWGFQFEETSAATPLHVGRESFTVEPAPATGMGRLIPIWNPGDVPTPVTVASSNAGTEAMYIWGPMCDGNMVDLMNTYGVQQIEDWTNGTDTAGLVDAGSSPGSGTSAKLTTFAGATAMTTRATRTITTGLDTLKGRTWVPLLRIGASTATYFGDLQMWLDWGSNGNPVQLSAAVGTSGLASGSYIELPFGPITFPDITTSNLAGTLRASRTSGTGQLRWDCLTWVPAEQLAYINADQTAMTSDPDGNLAYQGAVIGTSAGRVTEVRGPLPYYAPPGLSVLYMACGADWNESAGSSVWGSVVDTLSGSRAFRIQLTPRYLL